MKRILPAILLAACLPGWAAADCLEYGPNNLYGTLVRQTYAGPPDYKSISRGDKPLVIWVLLLNQLTCVVDSYSRSYGNYGEREVQLVLQEGQYEEYRNLLGKKVVVTGNLKRGRGDYKRLLIVPYDIARTSVRP
jgi:Domain of unknown function (DUF4431)